jgi:hypothetical protein
MPLLNAEECTAHQTSNAAGIDFAGCHESGHDPPAERRSGMMSTLESCPIKKAR